MLDFLAYLIGVKIGEKAAPVAMEGGSILLKVFKVLLSVWVWTFFCEAIGDVSIGLKVIDIIVALALVAYFLYCIYKIETKRVRRSKLFSVVCFLVVILTCGINIYLKSGIDIGWIIFITLGGIYVNMVAQDDFSAGRATW